MAAPSMEVFAGIHLPQNTPKVYKDECLLSYDTPDSEQGLYVCMSNFYGFGKRHVEHYSAQSGCRVFLNHLRITTLKPEDSEPEKKKPTKIAIDVEGGFASDASKFNREDRYYVVVLPSWTRYNLDDPSLPSSVVECANFILESKSALHSAEASALSSQWEGNFLVNSKYADGLAQLNNEVKVAPSGWKCIRCDLTSNLWLNLTCGTILCGRKNFDGSGGNNHAVEYYEETKYPLCVKLGTITPNGADVFSYAEDDMVLDPFLSKHLAHFGIDIMAMKQTDKTMVELEIDMNKRFGEWSLMQESNEALTPLYGPGYTGIHNLGNSCYINSCLQVLFTTQSFKQRYTDQAASLLPGVSLDNIFENFTAQMCRLGSALASGDYSKTPNPDSENIPKNGISPLVFKLIMGKNYPEFGSKKQQDVHEFLTEIFKLIERNSRGASVNPVDAFRLATEDRLSCPESGCVSYNTQEELMLSLSVPMDRCSNLEEVSAWNAKKAALEAEGKPIKPEDNVRSKITLIDCLDAYVSSQQVVDFYSTGAKKKVTACNQRKLSKFPKYLIIHVKKYVWAENWTPKKLDISLDVPDTLDLSPYKSTGRQPNEPEFPVEASAAPPQPVVDESVVAQLVDMGFGVEACKRAVYTTKNNGLEIATNWIMEHMGDPDFNDPFIAPEQTSASAGSGVSGFVPNPDGLAMIMSMGFTEPQATKALKNTSNSVERAMDWILSHPDELDEPEPMDTAPPDGGSASTQYKLTAFISHMGPSTESGHYVCHILKEGRWVIYNDEKVAVSKKPPRELAYIYMYEQVDE